MNCIFTENGAEDEKGRRSVRCEACGTVLVTAAPLDNIRCECTRPAAPGVGTELHKLLASLGIKPDSTCNCAALAAEWDRRGVEWCREHRDDVLVPRLREAYRTTDWPTAIRAPANAVSQGLPMTLAGLVDEAVRRAELDSAPQQV